MLQADAYCVRCSSGGCNGGASCSESECVHRSYLQVLAVLAVAASACATTPPASVTGASQSSADRDSGSLDVHPSSAGAIPYR